MNKVILFGRLTKEPEIRYVEGENPVIVCRYSLAVNEKPDKTYFFDCVAFGKVAEFAEKYLEKGKAICVSGKLIQNTYINAKGEKRSKIEIVVSEHYFI